MNSEKQKGFDFADGFLNCLGKYFLIGMLVLFVWSAIRDMFDIGIDDSDVCGYLRSGLKVHKDAKTGIEYLSDRNGGLVRREYR